MKFILAEVDKEFESIFDRIKINTINCFKKRQFNSTKLRKISGKFVLDKKQGIFMYITGDVDGNIDGVSVVDNNVNPIKVDEVLKNTVRNIVNNMVEDSVLSKT